MIQGNSRFCSCSSRNPRWMGFRLRWQHAIGRTFSTPSFSLHPHRSDHQSRRRALSTPSKVSDLRYKYRYGPLPSISSCYASNAMPPPHGKVKPRWQRLDVHALAQGSIHPPSSCHHPLCSGTISPPHLAFDAGSVSLLSLAQAQAQVCSPAIPAFRAMSHEQTADNSSHFPIYPAAG